MQTMKYGLIGKSLAHSYSKAIHALLGNSEYETLELQPDAVVPFLRKACFSGINVTIPYKQTVMPLCLPDDAAKKIGCVNTVVNKNGNLYGYNTDYFGFSYMAKSAGIFFEGKKVLVLGSGATSKTACRVARDSGAGEIIIVSRYGKDNYENISLHADSDILVNTTPVGMFPDNGHSPVSLNLFTKLYAVIDVIYNPLRTKLVLKAQERGIKTADGLSMLVAQALRSHKLFFGIEDNRQNEEAKIQEVLTKTRRLFLNIVLIGMPGSGKTSVGKKLAEMLGMDFIDTDRVIESSTGRKASDIIRKDGEGFFRELESRVIAQETAKSRRVIATGGGGVLAKENRNALLQNGTVIFLERETEKLETQGRPLSLDLAAMYRQRQPVYESLCHYKVKVDGSIEDTAKRVADCMRGV